MCSEHINSILERKHRKSSSTFWFNFHNDEFNRWRLLSEQVKLVVTDEEQSLWTWNQVKQMFEISIFLN
jgi:hypothetical protein